MHGTAVLWGKFVLAREPRSKVFDIVVMERSASLSVALIHLRSLLPSIGPGETFSVWCGDDFGIDLSCVGDGATLDEQCPGEPEVESSSLSLRCMQLTMAINWSRPYVPQWYGTIWLVPLR